MGEQASTEGTTRQALYPRLPPGRYGAGRSKLQTREIQRARMCGAMMEAVAEEGYERVSVESVAELAGVSKRSFYEAFATKEACYVAGFESVLAGAVAQIGERCEAHADDRLGMFFVAVAEWLLENRNGARAVALAPISLPPPALGRRKKARKALRNILRGCSEGTLAGESPPPPILDAVVHGTCRVLCARLLEGKTGELPRIAEELHAWMLCYRCADGVIPAAPPVKGARAGARCGARQPRSDRDVRLRLQRSALELAGLRGWRGIATKELLRRANVEEAELSAHYARPEECLIDALQLLAAELYRPVVYAKKHCSRWPVAVPVAIDALLEWVAAEPMVARVAFVEAFTPGFPARVKACELLSRYASGFARLAPAGERDPDVLAEAIAGAAWGMLHDHLSVRRKASACSPTVVGELRDYLCFLVLAPTTGGCAASAPASSLNGVVRQGPRRVVCR